MVSSVNGWVQVLAEHGAACNWLGSRLRLAVVLRRISMKTSRWTAPGTALGTALAACAWLSLASSVAQAAPGTEAEPRYWPGISRAEFRAMQGEGRKFVRPMIFALQYLLRARGYKATVDGFYGPQTESFVKAFQRKNGIVPSGAMNTATWEALVAPVRQNSRGDAVRAVQRLLRAADYNVPVDGRFGPSTRAATLKFQQVRGLPRDGIVGKVTWNSLVGGGDGSH
jgi:hypothetical protein